MSQTIQRSFTGGEIAPSMRARADLTKYATGLALCENFIIRAQGGIYSRPGTRFIGAVGQPSRRARLVAFSFNTAQTYILVFEHLTLRIIRDGGFVTVLGSPYQIATPYTEDQLSRLSFTQDADVLTIVHPSHSPRDLSRLADDNWTLSVINFNPTIAAPSWLASSGTPNISDVTRANPGVVTVASAHGRTTGDMVFARAAKGMTEINDRAFTVTVIDSLNFSIDQDTTNYGVFDTAALQGVVQYGPVFTIGDAASAGTYSRNYTYVVTAVSASGEESLPSAVQSIYPKTLSSTWGVALMWQPVTGADYYRVYKNDNGSMENFGWIGDARTPAFIDWNISPVTSEAPPTARDPFAGSSDKPSCVGFYQQRRIFANTTNEPQTVYATQTGVYNSLRYSTPSRADDAVTFTIAARQVNEIRHIIALDAMLLMTSGGEWRVTEGSEEVLTPSTVGARIQSYYGASWVAPVIIGDTVVFIQDKSARVRDLKYEFSDNKYSGTDLSVMAEHLFEGYTIEEIAYTAEPYGILWMVRSDGRLLGLTYQREHQVWAWHQHYTDGVIESVASVSEDGRDALYMVVNRTINGATVRYVERMEPRYTTAPEDSFCVDCGLSYAGAAATVITGLGHLEGEAVAVVADGYEVTGLTVSGGQITLPRAASKVTVGLPYTPAAELLNIDVSSTSETLGGKNKSVSRVILEVEKSRGGWVGPKLDSGVTGTMFEIKPRYESDGYGAIALKSFKQEVLIQPQWGKGGGIRIEQRAPFPLAILSVIPEIDVS